MATLPLSIENGTKYELVRGSARIVFNDSSDADFVGWLDGESGATGFDGADVREDAADLVEGDGGVHGAFYLGRRSMTFTGIVNPAGGAAAIADRITKMRRVINGALRDDLTINWQTTGGVPVTINARRQQPLRVPGRFPKNFQAALVASNPRIVTQALHYTELAASAGGAGGMSSPLTSPIISFSTIVGQILVENQGTFDAPPIFTINGPATNPIIRNNTTGKELRLIYTLGAGELLKVDVLNGTIKLNNQADRDSALDFANSEWWTLVPGVNDIRYYFSSYSAPASLAVEWRDTWE